MQLRLPGPRALKYMNIQARVIEIFLTLSRGSGFINQLHRRHGSVVQISRDEVSVNSAAALRDLYAVSRRLDRPGPLVIFHNYQAENLVSTENGDVHQERRKPLRSIYSASAVDARETQSAIQDSTKAFLQYVSRLHEPVEVKPILRLVLYEIMSHVVYGSDHALNLCSDAKQHSLMEADTKYQEDRLFDPLVILPAFFPRLTLWLRRHNLAPTSIAGRFPPGLVSDRIGREALAALQTAPVASATHPESLVHRLHSHYATHGPSTAVPSEAYILSDSLDHFWAGVSTTTDALAPLIHHLSHPQNLHRQQRLRRELHTAGITPGSAVPPSAELKRLPYLDAVIRETLRLNPPIPVGMARKVAERDGLVVVCGHRMRAGMTVGASPLVMGRNEEVYERADAWLPERWLVEDGDEGEARAARREKVQDMKRHFVAFGAGPRMCLGVNVAWAAMRAVVAGLYAGFETELVEGTRGRWWQRTPESKVRFRELERASEGQAD